MLFFFAAIIFLFGYFSFENLLKYSEINSVIGVLECAKMELYRRIAAPYEDKKCEENGDVYSIQKAPSGFGQRD